MGERGRLREREKIGEKETDKSRGRKRVRNCVGETKDRDRGGGEVHCSLLFLHASQAFPEGRGGVELEGVDQDEDQHGVHHHRHPEVLESPPPPLVVHLRGEKRGSQVGWLPWVPCAWEYRVEKK